MRHTIRRLCTVFALLAALTAAGVFADADADDHGADVNEMVAESVAFLVARQEGADSSEWPYEGVYREGGQIPMGYRVGGTALVSRALLAAPGWDDDEARRQAVARASVFVVESRRSAHMAHATEQTYDVRGWGYACALHLLADLERSGRIPDEVSGQLGEAATFFLTGIAVTEIPENSGWNYARRAGFDSPGRPSPFMTSTTLQALFAARDVGWSVDERLVERALAALEDTRHEDGGIVYAGSASPGTYDGLPGSIGRMLAVESTLRLADRGGADRLRGAVDAFFVHWQRLEERRAKTGTHKKPYGVAPYYFYYAHQHAAQAIELLPEGQRAEYRKHLLARLLRTRDASEGSWNDRVFPRSANYGTAMAVLALTAADNPPQAGWSSGGSAAESHAAGERR